MKLVDKPIVERLSYLRRRYRPHARVVRGPLEAIPLLNVVLLLLFFFIVNSSFVLQPGVVVNLPASTFTSGAPYAALVVTISQEGMVFFNDERRTLDGLSPAFAQAAYDHPDTALIIEADERVPNGTLIQIYNMAMSAGIRKVVIATRISADARSKP